MRGGCGKTRTPRQFGWLQALCGPQPKPSVSTGRRQARLLACRALAGPAHLVCVRLDGDDKVAAQPQVCHLEQWVRQAVVHLQPGSSMEEKPFISHHSAAHLSINR